MLRKTLMLGALGRPRPVAGHMAEPLESRLCLSGSSVTTFSPAVSFAAGATPYSVASADANRDGKADLITANYGAGTVSVLLGKGNGTFYAQRSFPVGSGPAFVISPDVNRDGIPDIAVVNSGDRSVGVLLGKGDGTFGPQKTFAVGENPTSLASADLNGDRRPDLVVANLNDATVSVLLGNGDGSFKQQMTTASSAGAQTVACADVNRDGRVDVTVVDSSSNVVGILLGNGDGTFRVQKTYPTDSSPISVAPADFNRDGKPDLVTANTQDSNNISVLLGNGDGTFQAQRTYAAGGPSLKCVTTADLNGDGKLDVVVASGDTNSVAVLVGNGDGSFQAQQGFGAGYGPNSVITADVNADGRPDLITADSYGDGVSVLLNTTPRPTDPIATRTFQAEAARISGAVRARNHGGFTGASFVDFIHPAGDYVEWTVEVPAAGSHRLGFRYANGSSPRAMALSVNGAVVRPRLSFGGTGSWDDWRVVTLIVPLKTGVNTIRLAAVGASGPNLDALTVGRIEPYVTTVQAERVARSGAAVDSRHAGFSGPGFVDFQHASGDWIEWAARVPAAGDYRFEVRYANGATSGRSLALRVNGVAVGRVSFPRTGGWEAWKTVGFRLHLTDGVNHIRLTTTGAEGPNIDLLALRPW